MTAIDLANWMKYLDPSVRVIDSYISCSHDASAYKYDGGDNVMHEFVGSICQSADYTGQLLAGSRWFDLRVTRDGNTLVTKHGIITFQPFETVLYQIKNFADSHKSEFIFLDLDLAHEDGVGGDVLAMLIKVLGDGKEDAFATAHVGPDGKMYNTDLTWAKLREDGKQYVVIYGEEEKWQVLGSAAGNIRDNWADDYEDKSPQEIVNWLDQVLAQWKKEKLWITQLIDTPKRSYMPGHHPSDCDSRAAPVFTGWLTKFKPGDKLGIVKRDFVNEGWNEPGISHVILLNKFTQSPVLPLGPTINYLSNSTQDTGRALRRRGQQPPREHKSQPADPGERANGQYSFPDPALSEGLVLGMAVHRVGDDTVVSCAKNSGGFMYWGVGWGPADDWETFLPYDPANPRSSAKIRDGSVIVLRTLWHMYWKAGNDENLYTRLNASTGAIEDATRFVVEKA
ncbi:hypothetical protein KXW88_000241 [Aspergillus fumigatus]|nr:hypothetical protein KXX42_005004 [Aspergillus fumigatus]KAH1988052.1 hypothetical protein KXW88_000241 [Aspergillus fumigatus]KAH2319066.1 hypothetical protein KXV47_006344 [Aspergillus fumigatus]KAH3196099.1 hypothetical protein KXW62_003658 [Aspergillus fumigatus]